MQIAISPFSIGNGYIHQCLFVQEILAANIYVLVLLDSVTLT